jgi:Spy/CpxP family protein refolding chaperone
MKNRSTPLALLAAALAAWTAAPLAAQPAPGAAPPAPAGSPEDTKALNAQVAYDDIPVILILGGLGVTGEQAGRLQPIVEEFQGKLRGLNDRLKRLSENALAEAQLARDALLAGQPFDVARARRLVTLDNEMSAARGDRRDALSMAMTAVSGVLTSQQQAVIAAVDAGEATPGSNTPDAYFRQQMDQALWQQYVANTAGQLLHDGRGESDPRRFSQLAPQAAMQAAMAITGLTADDPMMLQLANYFVAMMQQARRMNSGDFITQGPQLAFNMSRAALYVIQQEGSNAGPPKMGKAPPPPALARVSTKDLENVVLYERSPLLLSLYAKNRPTPFATPR